MGAVFKSNLILTKRHYNFIDCMKGSKLHKGWSMRRGASGIASSTKTSASENNSVVPSTRSGKFMRE